MGLLKSSSFRWRWWIYVDERLDGSYCIINIWNIKGLEYGMMNLIDNVKTTHYTYNAAGERIMKSYGTMEGVYINGAPQGIILTNVDFRLYQDKMSKLFCAWFALKFHETDNFTLYPASILSVNKNRFTKHYFIGDKRIASRIGTGLFNNVYGRNGSYVTAGQQDYAERMNQIQKQKEAYYKQQGIAPGVPTMKGCVWWSWEHGCRL